MHTNQRKTENNEQHTNQQNVTQIDAIHKIKGAGGRGGSLSTVIVVSSTSSSYE